MSFSTFRGQKLSSFCFAEVHHTFSAKTTGTCVSIFFFLHTVHLIMSHSLVWEN